MEVPAWLAGLGALLSFLGGLFGDLLKRIIPTYVELVTENRDLRKEVRDRDGEIEGLQDALRDEGSED